MVSAIGTGGQSGRLGRSAHLARPGHGRFHVAGPLGEARRHRLVLLHGRVGQSDCQRARALQSRNPLRAQRWQPRSYSRPDRHAN